MGCVVRGVVFSLGVQPPDYSPATSGRRIASWFRRCQALLCTVLLTTRPFLSFCPRSIFLAQVSIGLRSTSCHSLIVPVCAGINSSPPPLAPESPAEPLGTAVTPNDGANPRAPSFQTTSFHRNPQTQRSTRTAHQPTRTA